MPAAAAILAKLDAIAALVAELRAELAGAEAADEKGVDTIHTPAADLIDTHSAAARFGFPRDTIACWARQTAGTEQAIAIRSGGRWLIDPRKLRQRINGS